MHISKKSVRKKIGQDYSGIVTKIFNTYRNDKYSYYILECIERIEIKSSLLS